MFSFLIARLRPQEARAIFSMTLKWVVLGGAVGILAGAASALFLWSLEAVTTFRLQHPVIVWGLPVAGFVLGAVYHHLGGDARRGSPLIIEEVNLNRARIPRRMAVFVLLGTLTTHLFGGSAGREGTAVQMAASLSDALARALRLNRPDRRLLLMAGISAGFGSVFGTPVAGFVFGLEVQKVGRLRYEGKVPCLVGALVGDMSARAFGATHSTYPSLPHLGLEPLLLLKVALAGVAFGVTSALFIELTEELKALGARWLAYPPLRTALGGVAVLALTGLVGTRDYLGLSLPLIHASLDGGGVVAGAFLLKLIFTALTLGTGFLGGEVTPLFVMGATLGYTLGRILGLPPEVAAMLGFVAVFAGASNTPLACTLMGVELFGGGAVLYLALACFVAYLASGHRSIYATQAISVPKATTLPLPSDPTIDRLRESAR